MAASHQQRADENREIADRLEAKADALEALLEEIKTAETIGETRLSKLFHEARTTSKRQWSTVTAFVDIEDGEAEVRSIDKLSAGTWSPETRERYDLVLSVGIRPFMDSEMFVDTISWKLEDISRTARANAAQYRQDADAIERRAEGGR